MNEVGKSTMRVDAIGKVTGQAKYPGDLTMPDILHIQLVYSKRPHARLISIETDKAEDMPGVRAILTYKDVPQNQWGIVKQDREVFCSTKVRYYGDQIAAVVADTPEQSKAAANAIKIVYEDLPILSDPIGAMSASAVAVHEECLGNIVYSQKFQTGDVSEAFENADVIIEREYHTPMQEHAFLEPEAGLGYVDDEGVVTVICGGQDTHEDQHQIAHALDIPLEEVRVIYGPIGGAFGGREEISIQIILALATMKVNAPVKIVWDRSESFWGHCKRHAMRLRYKWSANRSGKITAAKMEIIADAGAYESGSISVLKNYVFSAIGPYEIPNIELETKAVYTNNIPGGAFRGYGFPQITFASELQISHLSEKLGIDPVSMRLKNCYRDGSKLPTRGEVPKGVNLEKLITVCAKGIGMCFESGKWQFPDIHSGGGAKKRGYGIAAGMKNSGFALGFPEGSDAEIILHGGDEIEKVTLITAAADVGQGSHTALMQIAANVLSVPINKISLRKSDTSIVGSSGPASASRLTLFAGNAVKHAALKALRQWQDEERPAHGYVKWKAPETIELEPAGEGVSQVNSLSYGAHAVLVEVDTQTGEIRVLKIVMAHDPGMMVNPQQVEGQIEGGVVQALGWALVENLVLERGIMVSDTLSTYLIPTALDIPLKTEIIIDEMPDPLGPFGARGIGEIPFIPLAPAIVSAVHQATDVWMDQIPVTAEKMVQKLRSS